MQKFTRTSQVSSGRRTLLQCIPASVLGLLSSSVLAAWGAEAADKAYPQRMAVSDTPQLASVSNFRDLAGASDAKAYQTVEGLWLQRGVIYRSNEMRPLPQDQAALAALGVSWVHDLRTPGEIARKPDLLPHGAQYVQNNILGLKNIDIEDFRVASSQEAESLMIRGI
ncbi:tyrosine-protein phosphatase [Comamonas sp. Y33R10-2]|nr:tyrosine-protein phosphatase [Comamonas sp. Y33R10-2]